MPPFAVAPFAGRKGSSERVALVELFTGSECPPCVAADVGFDAVEKAYKPTEVVLLQYHEHIPRPDPLTNPSAEVRMKYYDIEGTPSVYVNGKQVQELCGPLPAAKAMFGKYRDAIDPLLERTAPGSVRVSATRSGQRIDITAETSEWQETGEKIRLRLALVEDVVRFRGGNGQIYHHCVVRALPGGESGIAVADKATRQTASVDLDKLRKDLNQYLNQVNSETPFSSSERPMAMRHLRVVAFVQNDGTKEVLQAAQADVPKDTKVAGN
jgi:thiol-disulfide isomerase/thioredoxin